MHTLVLLLLMVFLSVPASLGQHLVYAQAPTIVPTQVPSSPTPGSNVPAPTSGNAPTSSAPTVAPTAGNSVPTVAPTAPAARAATPAPTTVVPTHISTANCDVCGYCNGMTADQVPSRWGSCRKCVYPEFGNGDIDPLSNVTIQGTAEGIPAPDLHAIYTDFGCLSTKPGEFASQISSFLFSIVGGIAFLFFIYGAGIIATSRSDPGKLAHGRRILYGAIAGLLFALFAVFIIRFVASGIGITEVTGN